MWQIGSSRDAAARAKGGKTAAGRGKQRRELPLRVPFWRPGAHPSRRNKARNERLAEFWDDLSRGRTGDWYTTIAASGFLTIALAYAVAAGGHATTLGTAVAGAADTGLSAAGLSVDKVTVTGRQRAGMDDILTALGVKRGDSILSFDTDAARFRIEQIGWVNAASVQRIFPNRVFVEVNERKPFAVWQQDGLFSVIDKEGARLSGLVASDFSHLPRIVGTGAGREAETLLASLDREPELIPLVRAAVRVGDRRWNLQMTNGVTVMLPETGAEPVLTELVKLEQEHNILSRDIRLIDFRLPDRVTIRLSEEAAKRRRESMALGGDVKRRKGNET